MKAFVVCFMLLSQHMTERSGKPTTKNPHAERPGELNVVENCTCGVMRCTILQLCVGRTVVNVIFF
jgi:hypothetical protein